VKILFVLKQKKNVETFAATIRALTERGHSIALAVQEHTDARADQYREWIDSPLCSVVRCPAHRTDQWSHVAWLLRSLRDCVHYQQPAMRHATKLQARSVQKLREELRFEAGNEAVADALRGLPALQVQRLEEVCGLAERQLPVDPVYEAFLRQHAPDVMLISPLVHFGSAQADFVAAARAVNVPVGMLLYSWDNLSTKGCLHRVPDWMFVWNDRQRAEANALHGFPEDRVFITGAPRFDSFFELKPRLTREQFHAPLGLDSGKPTLLYVCSSLLVSAGELPFVRAWLAAIRESSGTLRDCNILVRPHPDIELLGEEQRSEEEVLWPGVRGAKGFVSRPFDDPRAIVLKTSDRARQGLFESIYHSAAVVGLNTSAELEAAIVGRPVYTVIAGDEAADGQSSTLHFHYLLEEQGGCVRRAGGLAEHVAQLQGELDHPRDSADIRRFAGEFLRPHGLDQPVAPVFADAIERAVGADPQPQVDQSRAVVQSGREADPMPSPQAQTGEHFASLNPKYGYSLRVHASPKETRGAYHLQKGTLVWLKSHVAVGDVVYDIDCGVGVYAMVAAKYHGAVVVAFEPAYAAFKALCDNLHLNGCDGSVLPISLALADFEGMGELKYAAGLAGWGSHSLRRAEWKVRRSTAGERRVRQPAYVMPLDQAVSRYNLPAPHHLHLNNARSVERVLAGAPALLGSDRLKTLVLTLAAEEGEDLAARLAPLKWFVSCHTPMPRGRVHLVLSRATPPVAAVR
jgi:FkbM family methyltransferase